MIISCGEALIDFFKIDETGDFKPLLGGSLMNVAVAMAKAGNNAALMTNLSTDQFGDRFFNYLIENNVSTKYVVRSDHQTGLMVVAYNADKSASYNYYGHNSAELSYEYNAQTLGLSDDVNCLHFGSFCLVIGKTASSYPALIADEHKNRIISIDLNIRDTVEGDMQLWDASFDKLLPMTHIAKASADDVMLMHGLDKMSQASCFEYMQSWQDKGAKMSVITDADKGAYILWKGEQIHLMGKKADIIDTVGAGDCFMANFLCKLDRDGLLNVDGFDDISVDQVKAAAGYAIDAATFTIAHKGAVFPAPTDL
uniref:Carbohydrate kinase PfkB domain-containing protein n=1 Tax=OCS116 cluster bacterium TaxID=2030921 RepID=A0A2A4YUU4_9PROT